MRRSVKGALVAPAVLALALVSACGSSSKGSDTPAPDDGTSAALSIESFDYKPSPLTVTPGQKVTVTNKDSAKHTATGSKGEFDSRDVKANGKGSFTAPTAPGTYTIICTYHSNMRGTLIVK